MCPRCLISLAEPFVQAAPAAGGLVIAIAAAWVGNRTESNTRPEGEQDGATQDRLAR